MDNKFNQNLHNQELLNTNSVSRNAFNFYSTPITTEESRQRIKDIKFLDPDVSKPKIVIRLGLPQKADKFNLIVDNEGREYVVALPIQKYPYHADIANFCRKIYKKDIKVLGGGYVRFEGDTLVLEKQSEGFGEADKLKVKELIQKQFPDLDIKVITVAEENKNTAQKNAINAYEKKFNTLTDELQKHLFADVIFSKAVKLGYDMIHTPVIIEDEKGSKYAYMLYRSENGSSFGFDTMYFAYKDANGAFVTKEIARSRWEMYVKDASVKEGVLTMKFKSNGKEEEITLQLDNLNSQPPWNDFDEREKIIFNMYASHQDVYHDPVNNRTHYMS